MKTCEVSNMLTQTYFTVPTTHNRGGGRYLTFMRGGGINDGAHTLAAYFPRKNSKLGTLRLLLGPYL